MIEIYDELRRLVAAFEGKGLRYALCGGLAMAVHGRPRATLDIDFLVGEEDLREAIACAASLGYGIPGQPMPVAGGRLRIHRVVKVDEQGRDLLPLDLIAGDEVLRDVWEEVGTVEWEGAPLRIVSAGGMVALKRLRGSGMDQADIDWLEGGGSWDCR